MRSMKFSGSMKKFLNNRFLNSNSGFNFASKNNQIIYLAKVMKLPKLGDSISDATIFKYHKSIQKVIYLLI